MNITEILTLVALLLTAGWVGAFIAQAIKRPAWPSSVKLILALVVAGLVGIATAYLSGSVLGVTAKWGSLTATDVLAFGAIVYTASAVWYNRYFKGTVWAESLGSWPAKR